MSVCQNGYKFLFQEVTALLGKPIATEHGKWTQSLTSEKIPFVRHTYQTDIAETSVMFIAGHATRIVLKPKGTFAYPQEANKAQNAIGFLVEERLNPRKVDPLFLDYGVVNGYSSVKVVKDTSNPAEIGFIEIVPE